MMGIYFNIFILAVAAFADNVQTQNDPDYYKAAVMEFHPFYDATETPFSNMILNIDEYVHYIKKASAAEADIIIFPEYGITTVHLLSKPEYVLPYSVIIPVKTNGSKYPNPCVDLELTNNIPAALKQLSCSANQNNIYVIVNLVEREMIDNNDTQWILFNTNIVFNRNGDIITKYRKYNLFMEDAFNVTKEPELITFTTDFNVTFGTFTCFDILFAEPALTLIRETNVTDIIYPSAWFSELPFLTAIQTQAGWARANGVNLLASGYSNPSSSSGGSGIYSVQHILKSFVPIKNNSEMLVAHVPKIKKNHDTVNLETRIYEDNGANKDNFVPELRTKAADMSNYTIQWLTKNFDDKICYDNFCCTFQINFSLYEATEDENNYKYVMAVYQGNRSMGTTVVPIQVCGIVACLNENITTCGIIDYNTKEAPKFSTFYAINISGNFAKHNKSVIFPSTVYYNLITVPYDAYDYTSNTSKTSITLLRAESNLLTFGIFAQTHTIPSVNFASSLGALHLWTIILPILITIYLFVKKY